MLIYDANNLSEVDVMVIFMYFINFHLLFILSYGSSYGKQGLKQSLLNLQKLQFEIFNATINRVFHSQYHKWYIEFHTILRMVTKIYQGLYIFQHSTFCSNIIITLWVFDTKLR